MSELLIELFSEEIPARMQPRAAAELERVVNKVLIGAGFLPEGVKAFSGPRRLTLVAAGLPARQPDRREEKKGPRVGAPEKAVEGFLKSAGLASLDSCEQREDKKGAYWVAVIDNKGRDTADLIAEAVPEIVRGFSWAKSMRWGAGELKWVRPLHGVLCVFDGEVVPFEIDGIVAGDVTQGHRFMAPGVINARSFEAYERALRAGKVILDGDERREIIARDAATLAQAQGLELVEDAGLLGEVSGLAEWPVAMMGAFDEKFLALPDEVLTASMRGHQKYFSVRDPKTGRLSNRFIYVANLEAPDGGKAMREGYERVLTARLSDGWYLYNQDLKKPLAERIADLDRVTFFEGLGSVGDKARRIAALAKEIAPNIKINGVGADPELAERAAMLAKADLVTGMVYEFPELQGVMGRYYALAQGEAAEVADAIRDHYKPAGQDDDVPTAPVSVAVALADKIDTLTAFWAIDKKPTGSSDPFALRRAALGVIKLTLENNVNVWLCDIIRNARLKILEIGLDTEEVRKYRAEKKVRPKPGPGKGLLSYEANPLFGTLVDELFSFLLDRLEVYVRDLGYRYDVFNAIKDMQDDNYLVIDNVVLIVARLKALEAFLKTDDGANLASAYKRAANILKAEEKKDKAAASDVVDEKLLKVTEEKALHKALTAAEAKTDKAVAAEDFEAAMSALASLRGPLDAFFESVTVNADDAKVRTNRLALLARLRAATAKVADFSRLEG